MFLHFHEQPSTVPEPNKSFVQICISQVCLSKNQIAVQHGEPSLVLCDDLEGWEGGGRGGREGCMYNYGWFALLYGRNQHNIVKILNIYIYIFKLKNRKKEMQKKKKIKL